MTQNPTRAVGYIRVSTEEQSREGVSLDAQREKIEAYCSLHDLELVAIEEDAGLSGKRMVTRPGLQSALRRIEAGEASALVAYKIDRLSRSSREFLELAERFQKRGWGLHSIVERLDTDSGMGRFAMRLFASIAELERDLIGERTKMALAHKAAKGERVSGRAPLGFRFEDGRTVPDKHEWLILTDIWHWHAKEGRPNAGIAVILNRRQHRTRNGKPWTADKVGRAIATIKKHHPDITGEARD